MKMMACCRKTLIWLDIVACLLLVQNHLTSSAPLTSNTSEPTTKNNVIRPTLPSNTTGNYLKHCTLSAPPENISAVTELAVGQVMLIKYNLDIPGFETVVNGSNTSLMYRPLFWVRSTGRHGLGLLLLKPNYDRLSLRTLELGVEHVDVTVIQYPPLCLQQVNDGDRETLLRTLVMNNFKNTSSGNIDEMKPNDNVCNLHIIDESGIARFKYYCCQWNEFKPIECRYLKSDIWLDILFAVITLIKVLVVLFSPKLVPDVYYRVKHVAASYIHKCQQEQDMKLTVAITTSPDSDCYRNSRIKIKLSKLCRMEGFKEYISRMKLDVPRRIQVSQINLRVKYDRLLPADYAPVGLLSALYETFVRCGISKRPSVKDCCNADFCFKSPRGKACSWYNVLKTAMKVLLLILLATPWGLRVHAYYTWEHDEIYLRKEAATERNLQFYFPGNFTVFLTPLHVLFLIIYVLLSIESLIFGVLKKRVQERLKMVLRKCFRDMRELSKMDVMGWAVKLLIKPCTRFGGLGICVGALFWVFALPFTSVVLAFYLIPTLNITLRLLAHFAVYLVPANVCTKYACCARVYKFLDMCKTNFDMENISTYEKLEKNKGILSSNPSRLQQCVVIILCLISMYSVIFLVTEFASFIVDVLVYTFMGIILNASSVMTYVSLFVILGLYGNQVFGHVTKRFLAFNEKMNNVILDLCKEKVLKIIYSNEQNFAFRLKTENCSSIDEPIELIKDNDGHLQWRVKRLCLFLSTEDVPLIPTSFYFTSCCMPFYAAPGVLLLQYLKASIEFGAILLFLVFVLIVVLAFGDTYEISATNKLLATVVGGFLPFMLKKIIFKTHTLPTINSDSIHFQACLTDLLATFEESWPVYDIDVHNDYGNVDTSDVSLLAADPVDLLIDVRSIDKYYFPDMSILVTSPQDPTTNGKH